MNHEFRPTASKSAPQVTQFTAPTSKESQPINVDYHYVVSIHDL